tara:strand:+ start:610 stop:882 length:273 start_codon:yes stop_codon:yes gene_type:complete
MQKRNKILISGNVQGVFLRKFIQDNAIKLNLKGSVKNLSNNKVEVIVQGSQDSIKKLIQLCKQRPLPTKITNIKTLTLPIKKETNFKILH